MTIIRSKRLLRFGLGTILLLVLIGAYLPYEKLVFFLVAPVRIPISLKTQFAGGDSRPFRPTGFFVIPHTDHASQMATTCANRISDLAKLAPPVAGTWHKEELNGQKFYHYIFKSAEELPTEISFTLSDSAECGEVGEGKFILESGSWRLDLSGPLSPSKSSNDHRIASSIYDKNANTFEVIFQMVTPPEPMTDVVAYQVSNSCRVQNLNCEELPVAWIGNSQMKVGPFVFSPDSADLQVFFKSELARGYVRPLANLDMKKYLDDQAQFSIRSNFVYQPSPPNEPSGFLKTPVELRVVLFRSELANQIDPNPQVEIELATTERLVNGEKAFEFKVLLHDLNLLPKKIQLKSNSPFLGEKSQEFDPFKEFTARGESKIALAGEEARWKINGLYSSIERLKKIATKEVRSGYRFEKPESVLSSHIFFFRNAVLYGISDDKKNMLHVWAKQAVVCRDQARKKATLGFLLETDSKQIERAFECDRSCREIEPNKALKTCSIQPHVMQEMAMAQLKPFDCSKCDRDADCLLSCYAVCERWGGGQRIGVEPEEKAVHNCASCKGEVITLSDSGPADGITLRVCYNPSRAK